MSSIYTRAYLIGRINAGIKGKIGMLTSQDDTVNQAVREVVSDIDVYDTIKTIPISPNLFSDIYSYPAPIDIKGSSIIDIAPQINRNSNSEITLTTPEEFDIIKNNFRCAVKQENELKKILISIPVNDTTKVVSTLDSVTSGGGLWETVGDAVNLVASSDKYVKGISSLKYDIGSGATTTAGIKNNSLTSFDITEFMSNQLFHYQYLSNPDNISNFTLHIGSSESDYYQIVVTLTHESTSFQSGWNLLRFDFINATTVGTPDKTNCTYVSVFMTKTAGKINQYAFYADHLWLKKGETYMLSYYSKYGWRDATGAYIENSTSDSDYIVCDTDAMELFILKGTELAAYEVSEDNTGIQANARYAKKKDSYESDNPSRAKLLQTTYYQY